MSPSSSFQDTHSKLQKEVDRAVRQRVLDGIELLKKEYGEDWVNKVDLDRLDLSSGTSCVLGQVYGEYSTGLNRLGYISGSAYAFERFSVGDTTYGYDELDVAWTQEIWRLQGGEDPVTL